MDKLFQDVMGAVLGSAILGGCGLLVTWGVVRQMVRDLKEQQLKTDVRIERLQDDGRQVPQLAQAIEHMGDKLATALQNLADRWEDRHGQVKAELDELKQDLKRTRTRREISRQSGNN